MGFTAVVIRRLFYIAASFLSVIVAVYAIGVYGFIPWERYLPAAFLESFNSRSWVVAAHILASAIALMLGPIQFSKSLREWRPAWHRLVGRVYLCAAVPIGGVAGLYLSGFAFGGEVTRLGFGTLAIVWLYTAYQGYVTARVGNFAAHRRWLIRNFSLTFAAVTLRLYLMLSQLLDLPFESSYQVSSWLCWVPNLLAVECWNATNNSKIATKPTSSNPSPTRA